MAVAAEDVDQVAQLGAAVAQRESTHCVYYNDAPELSGADLKTHGEFATFGGTRNDILPENVPNRRREPLLTGSAPRSCGCFPAAYLRRLPDFARQSLRPAPPARPPGRSPRSPASPVRHAQTVSSRPAR